MGPGELFEYHMQNLFEDWAFRREWEDFSEEDLIEFCEQSPFLRILYNEFRAWRDLQT